MSRLALLRRAARRVPGARRAVHAVRSAVGRENRAGPLRPPYGPPDRVAALSRTPADESFITGNGIAARCGQVLNYDVLLHDSRGRPDWWFCKTDYLEYFFAEHCPQTPFVLFSHNSDLTIGERFLERLDDPRLMAWFAQNPAVRHPKLRAFPIGIANPFWPHGDQAVLQRVQREAPEKTVLFDVSFNPVTNPDERRRCLEQTGLELQPRVPFEASLRRLASARFCISPRGNGIDCHRTWEALYLRTIPVVTRSLVTEQHPDVPMVVLDDWSQFGAIDFSAELYDSVLGDWTPDAIRLDRYVERVERTIATLAAPSS